MQIKPFIHTSLFIALMLGEISIGNSNSYYEDDDEFTSTSTQLKNGWGWYHLNSANATCTEQTECLTVIGVPVEEDDYDPFERNNDEPEDRWDYEPSGGGGDSDSTQEQEQKMKLAVCLSKANDDLKICKDDSARHRISERQKCEEANSLQFTLIRVGGALIKKFGGKAIGLLPGNEDLSHYVGQNCDQQYQDDLFYDVTECEHKEKREIIICEAVHGN